MFADLADGVTNVLDDPSSQREFVVPDMTRHACFHVFLGMIPLLVVTEYPTDPRNMNAFKSFVLELRAIWTLSAFPPLLTPK